MTLKYWLLGSAMVLAACKGEPAKPADTSPPPAATAPAAADVAEAPADVAVPDAAPAAPDAAPTAPDAAPAANETTVRLTEAGAEPRRELRYTAATGFTQSALLRMTTELELGSAGQKMPTALPKTKMTIDAKVGAVDASGDSTIGITISEADIAEGAEIGASRAAEKLAEVIRGMKGLAGDKVATSRGISHRFTLAAPAGAEGIMASAALRPVVQGFERSIDHMTVPLPAEAVGVGAKWEVTQAVVEAGMNLEQTTSYELTAVKGDVLSLRFTIALKAPPGKLESTFAGGLTAQVTRLEGSGEGSIEVDLAKVLPVSLAAKNRISMSLEMDAPDAKRELDVEMRVALEVGP